MRSIRCIRCAHTLVYTQPLTYVPALLDCCACSLLVCSVLLLFVQLGQVVIAAAESGDYAPLQQLQQALSFPFTPRAEWKALEANAPEESEHIALSCSS